MHSRNFFSTFTPSSKADKYNTTNPSLSGVPYRLFWRVFFLDMSKLPKIQDLYNDKLSVQRNDAFVTLLNQQPKPEWVKVHPYISNYRYLPIERVEYLLKTIFKQYRIEITGQGTSFNGVWVTVRVHYCNPIDGTWSFHDGIGASELQLRAKTKEEKDNEAATGIKFRVPFSTENINNGAIAMAYPLAKTVAIKDACDHFGKLFGSDLNRKDVINYELDLTLIPMDKDHPNWPKIVEAVKSGSFTIEQIETKYQLTSEAKDELTGI